MRFLGPCDKDGKILEEPKVRLEGVRSFRSAGRVLAFFPAVEKLRVRRLARETLGVDEEVAGHYVVLSLNQVSDGVADEHLPEWVGSGPLPRLLSLSGERLTPETFENVRSALCDFSPKEPVLVDRGLDLQKALTRSWRSLTREPPGVYYDVTKVEFHGWTSPLAQLGHDANGGISTVVGFGMVVSEKGHHPYLCKALPGNQNDSLGVEEAVAMLRERGYRHLRLVMDRGMISKKNLDYVRREGYQLVGLVKGWDWETLALASRWSEEDLENPEHAVRTSRSMVYARAMTTPLYGIPKVRVSVVVNLDRKSQDRKARDPALREWCNLNLPDDRIEDLRKELQVQNEELRRKGIYAPGLLLKSVGRRGAVVDEEAVMRDRAIDGRFLIFSTDLSLSGPEMYRTYFARDGIEKVFRTAKGELNLEPTRRHRWDRLYGCATVLYTASLLWSWTEQTLHRKLPQMSLTEALRHLENVAWMRSGSEKSPREWWPRLTEKQEGILSALGATRYMHSP